MIDDYNENGLNRYGPVETLQIPLRSLEALYIGVDDK